MAKVDRFVSGGALGVRFDFLGDKFIEAHSEM